MLKLLSADFFSRQMPHVTTLRGSGSKTFSECRFPKIFVKVPNGVVDV